MARVEFNLWDANTVEVNGNVIVVETADLQLTVILPFDVEIPEWGYKVVHQGKLNLEEIVDDTCTHPAIMHKISGGCFAPGCKCELTRNDQH